MGDLPKGPEDATWTEVERSFFAAAPPEEAEPPAEALRPGEPPVSRPARPRRAVAAWLRPAMATVRRRATLVGVAAGGRAVRIWRKTALILGAAGARARGAARAGAASLADGLSNWRGDRRVVPVLMAAVVAGWVSTGGITHGNGPAARDLTAEREAPAGPPTVAEAAPLPLPASEAAASPPTIQPSSVWNRPPRAHRRSGPAASPAQRPVLTAFMDRRAYWAQEGFRDGRSAPVRSSRPFFSR